MFKGVLGNQYSANHNNIYGSKISQSEQQNITERQRQRYGERKMKH